MKHTTLFGFYFLFCIQVIAQFKSVNNLQFQWYNASNGLEANVVNNVIRDRIGNVWISTNFGLTKYDGNSFLTYHRNSPQIPLLHDAVLQVLPVNYGQELLIATLNGTMLIKENNQKTVISTIDSNLIYGLHFNNAALFEIDSFKIVTASDGLLVFTNNTKKVITSRALMMEDRFSANNNICILKTHGQYLIGARNKLFFTSDFNQFQFIDSFQNKNEFIIGAIKKSEDEILFYGENLLCEYNLKKKSISKNHFVHLPLNEYKGKIIIETAAFDEENNLWFGIYKFGLLQLNARSGSMNQMVMNNDINFSGINRIHKIYFDSLFHLWVATDNGLYYLNNKLKHATCYNKNNHLQQGLPGNQCRVMLECESGILIGTTVGIGLLDINTNKLSTIIDDPEVVVNCILKDSKGRYWWGGTNGIGMFSLDGKNRKVYPKEISGKSVTHRIWQMVEKDGNIWFATLNGHICKYDPEKNEVQKVFSAENNSFFSFLLESDELVVAGIGTIYKYYISKQSSDCWNLQSEFQNIQFTKIEKLKNGHYLCATQGKGLFEIDLSNERINIQTNSAFQELDQKVIYTFHIRDSRLVIAASSGIYYYELSADKPRKLAEIVLSESPFTFGNTLLINHKGSLFVGGNNGFTQIPLQPYQETNFHIPVLTSMEANNQNINYLFTGPNHLEIQKGNNSILLNFAVPWLLNEPIHYWAKINDRVVHLGRTGLLNLSALKPGSNEFFVACSKNNSIDAAVVWYKYTVYLDAYFYQTTLFKISIAILILGILTYLIGLYVKNRIAKRKTEAAMLQLQLAKTKAENERLTTMRMQMNPHFLFNTLSGIQSMVIEGKVNESADYISKFARLIRELFQNSHENFIPIENEFQFVQKYCALQQLRHPHIKLHMSNSCTNGILIPPMLVQPLVENVFLHAFTDIKKNCELHINYEMKGEMVVIEIRDNGVGIHQNKSGSDDHFGISMQTVKDRLYSLYKETSRIEIYSFPQEGTKIILQFPTNYK